MMLDAAIDYRGIYVKYRSVKGKVASNETRHLFPIHILIRQGGVYALCRDLTSETPEQIKSFALHRLEIDPTLVELNANPNTTDQPTAKMKSIDLRARMEQAVGGLPDDNQPCEVELVYRDLPGDRAHHALNMGLGETWTKRQTQRIHEIKINQIKHLTNAQNTPPPLPNYM